MNPLIQAAAGVLDVDAADLARRVAAVRPDPPLAPEYVERWVRNYYAGRPLPAGFHFYERYGLKPAVVWTKPGAVIRNEEASIVTAAPPPKPPPSAMAAVASSLRQLTSSGAELWNDEILRLQSIAFHGDTAHASFAIGRFFDYRFTTGLLGDEAIAGGHVLRDALMPAVEGFARRFTGGGLQALVAVARPAPYDDFAIPLQVRSRRVSDGQGLHGVIPMAYHQAIPRPGGVDARGITTALRELAEELCGMDEKQTAEFETLPAVAELRREAILEILGFSLNLVNGNYDYNILICHPDPAYWEAHARHWSPSWEAARTFLLSSRDHGTFHRLISQEAWVPQSLVSLCEGLDRLRTIDPRRFI